MKRGMHCPAAAWRLEERRKKVPQCRVLRGWGQGNDALHRGAATSAVLWRSAHKVKGAGDWLWAGLGAARGVKELPAHCCH